MCRYSGERVYHLLLHGLVAVKLWGFSFFWDLVGITEQL